jgi:hypothetical protein
MKKTITTLARLTDRAVEARLADHAATPYVDRAFVALESIKDPAARQRAARRRARTALTADGHDADHLLREYQALDREIARRNRVASRLVRRALDAETETPTPQVRKALLGLARRFQDLVDRMTSATAASVHPRASVTA